MRGRLVSGENAAPFRFADLVDKAVRDTVRYSSTVRPRSAHRSKMEWDSLVAFAPPRYYITRSGSDARPWWLERVSLGKAEGIAGFRTHAEAVAEADKWVSYDAAPPRPPAPRPRVTIRRTPIRPAPGA